jgi:hypothetical protein
MFSLNKKYLLYLNEKVVWIHNLATIGNECAAIYAREILVEAICIRFIVKVNFGPQCGFLCAPP